MASGIEHVLTLDVGNTNASAAFVSFVRARGGGAPEGLPQPQPQPLPLPPPLGVRELGSWSSGDVSGLARSLEAAADRSLLTHAALSAVGASEREEELRAALVSMGFAVVARPPSGLHMDIESPETCGSDRQYAMRGALGYLLSREGAAGLDRPMNALVVDAGTALTVDAGSVRAPADSSSPGSSSVGPAFLGGAIAMGPGSLSSALTGRGARLPAFTPYPDAPGLGRSTEAALQSGVAVGFRGAVKELARSIRREAFGLEAGVTCFLTGGARDFAREAVRDVFGADVIELPALVHMGLARAARAAWLGGGGGEGLPTLQAGPS